MPKITLGAIPGKKSKLAKSMQQYYLTYSGRVPIKHIYPLGLHVLFNSYESQWINEACWHDQRKD